MRFQRQLFWPLTSAIELKIPESIEKTVWKAYHKTYFSIEACLQYLKNQFICEEKKSFQSKRAMFLSYHEHFC